MGGHVGGHAGLGAQHRQHGGEPAAISRMARSGLFGETRLASLAVLDPGTRLARCCGGTSPDSAFLREDQADLADIVQTQHVRAQSLASSPGYEPDAVAEAIQFHDLRKLVGQHTGLVSVQMQPPVENNHDKEEAEVLLDQAKTLQALLDAGATMESAIKAIQAHDLSLVKEDPQAALRWTPDGRAMMTTPGATPPGGAKPPAAGGKPATSAPTGQPKKPTPGGGAGG
jgi:hypothetical protein